MPKPLCAVSIAVVIASASCAAPAQRSAPAPTATVQPAPAVANAVSLTAAERAVYVGTYTFPLPNGVALVTHVADEDGQLVIWAEGKKKWPLIPLGNHAFGGSPDEQFRLRFTVDSGRVTRVTLEETGLPPVQGAVSRP